MSAEALCPYCRVAVAESEGSVVICTGCRTPHHADCFEENVGCTVFGCTAAPPAEPKLSIETPDLHSSLPSAHRRATQPHLYHLLLHSLLFLPRPLYFHLHQCSVQVAT
jgi:hypothetical protein